MPKRLSINPKTDPIQLASKLINDTTETTKLDATPTRSEISRFMAAMGRKGGKKSAKARMEKIPPEQRSQIAANAARAMWAKKKAAELK
jgi:hypothetical protein